MKLLNIAIAFFVLVLAGCETNPSNSRESVYKIAGPTEEDIINLENKCYSGESYYCTPLANYYYAGVATSQNKSRAIDLWKKACNINVAEACFNLGKAYLNREEGLRGNKTAIKLLTKACDKRERRACTHRLSGTSPFPR